MPKQLHVLSSREIYKGRLIQLKVDRIIEPGGVRAEREVVHHPGSVVVLAHSDDGRIVLVRQYRYAAKQFLWELVAGGLELRNSGPYSTFSPAQGSFQRRCSWSKRLNLHSQKLNPTPTSGSRSGTSPRCRL